MSQPAAQPVFRPPNVSGLGKDYCIVAGRVVVQMVDGFTLVRTEFDADSTTFFTFSLCVSVLLILLSFARQFRQVRVGRRNKRKTVDVGEYAGGLP